MKLILALIDFSRGTDGILALAGQLARATNCRLMLLHVTTPDSELVHGTERPDASRRGLAVELRRRHRELRVLEIELRKLGVNAVSVLCRSGSPRGNPGAKIVESIARHDPDLVLVGSHFHGRLHHLLGESVTDAVVRKAHRPVLLVPIDEDRGVAV
jgi:nucleotide-binding universal stress UspA family protein